MTPEQKWKKLDGIRVAGCRLVVSKYREGGRHAIIASNLNGDFVELITVNLMKHWLRPDEFFVRREMEKHSHDILDGLRDYAEPTGRAVGSGYVAEYADVWRLRD